MKNAHTSSPTRPRNEAANAAPPIEKGRIALAAYAALYAEMVLKI